jgi:hypothetical protein
MARPSQEGVWFASGMRNVIEALIRCPSFANFAVQRELVVMQS